MSQSDAKSLKLFENEVQVMAVLKKHCSDNIVKYESARKTENRYYLITEVCNGGDLSKLLDYRESQSLSEEEARLVFM
jgi:serine/threonine protein kinase